MRLITPILLCVASLSGWAQQWDTLPVLTDPGNNVVVFDEYQGDLLVVGVFTQAGGVTVNGVARWDGNAWSTFGSGITNVNGGPKDVVITGDTIVLSGIFGEVDGLSNTEKLAVWNGSSWSSLTMELPSSSVNAVSYKGDLYVGGPFGPITGSMTGACIGRWDGADWNDVGGGVSGGGLISVEEMIVFQGDLYIGGDFNFAGGTFSPNIARWDGAQWNAVGSGTNNTVRSFAVDTVNDVLYVGGGFTTAGGISSLGIAAWDGTNWSGVGGGLNCDVYAEALAIYNQKLYVGGCMTLAGGTVPVNQIACFDGAQWTDVGGGCNNSVSALYAWNDTLWVGGYFDTVAGGTLPAYYLAKWYDPTYGTLGLNELENERIPLTIYPNPSDGSFTVEVPEETLKQVQGDCLVQIIDMHGRLVEEITITNGQFQTTINSSNWSNGTYQCNLVVGGRVVGSETVVVE